LEGVYICNIEEVKKELFTSLEIILNYYHLEDRKLRKLAIFNGNYTKNQVWFTIIGIGLTLNWTNSKYTKIKKGWKYLGITSVNGIKIGKLLIFFQNQWRWKG
jgi:hypothetical protein